MIVNVIYNHDNCSWYFRAMLTAIHQNNNNDRKQKYNQDGTERTRIQRRKTTNLTPTAYWAKEDADYSKCKYCRFSSGRVIVSRK